MAYSAGWRPPTIRKHSMPSHFSSVSLPPPAPFKVGVRFTRLIARSYAGLLLCTATFLPSFSHHRDPLSFSPCQHCSLPRFPPGFSASTFTETGAAALKKKPKQYVKSVAKMVDADWRDGYAWCGDCFPHDFSSFPWASNRALGFQGSRRNGG